MPNSLYTHRGFTLLELLIAISIFALLSLMAYSSLDSAVKQKQIGEAQATALRRLQLGLLYIERDLQQAVNRPVQEGLEQHAAMEYLALPDPLIRLTRTGWSNPLGRPRGNLQRLAYGLKEGKLYRYSWQHLDSLDGEQPQEAVLLEGVEEWHLRLMDSKRQWQQSWPPRDAEGKATEALPLAVELELQLKGWGKLRRLIRMGES